MKSHIARVTAVAGHRIISVDQLTLRCFCGWHKTVASSASIESVKAIHWHEVLNLKAESKLPDALQ